MPSVVTRIASISKPAARHVPAKSCRAHASICSDSSNHEEIVAQIDQSRGWAGVWGSTMTTRLRATRAISAKTRHWMASGI
jgi:hypothetical protein